MNIRREGLSMPFASRARTALVAAVLSSLVVLGGTTTPPAHAGRLGYIGADVDMHCMEHGAMCRYLGRMIGAVREGAPDPARPVLLVDTGELALVRAVELQRTVGEPAIPYTAVAPGSAAWTTTPLDTARWSAIVLTSDDHCGLGQGGDCGSLNENGALDDSAAIFARAADLAAFVDAGGGILALSAGAHGDGERSGGDEGYYGTLPTPLLLRARRGPYTASATARALGIGDGSGAAPDELNCRYCSTTHNAFDVRAGDTSGWLPVQVAPAGGPAVSVLGSAHLADGRLVAGDAPPPVSPARPASGTAAGTTTSTPLGAATPAPVFVTPSTIDLTPPRACVSRRRFLIRIRELGGVRLASARVLVNGRRVAGRRGARMTAVIDLRGLPKGRFTVAIRARTTAGQVLRGARRYRTCTPRMPSGVPRF